MGRKKQTPGATDSPELAKYKSRQPEISVNAYMSRFALPLIGANTVRVTVNYSGSGDSGQIDEISCLTKSGVELDLVKATSQSFATAFEDFLYTLLDQRGWDVNNEGGQGRLVWDVAGDAMKHEHEDNVLSVRKHHYVGVEDLINTVDPEEAGRK